MQYGADRYASEVDNLVLSTRPMVKAANQAYGASEEVLSDLMRFVLMRHANLRLGANVKPYFLEMKT